MLVIFEDAEDPNVLSVFINKGRKLQTTRSWNFLGLERNGLIPSDSIWKKARFGEDTIIANIDTGKFSLCHLELNITKYFVKYCGIS